MKNKMTFFWGIDQRLWGERLNTNPYLATLSIIVVALAGALVGGGSLLAEWFDWNTTVNLAAMVGSLIVIWGYNVTESIIGAEDWKVALWRSLLLLGVFLLAFIAGVVLSVVVICAVVIWLVIMVLLGALRGSAGGSAKRITLDDGTELSNGRSDLLGGGSSYSGNDGHTYHTDDGHSFRQE